MLAASGVVRVLYVDDDPGIARLVRKHLERAGYAVTVAADGTRGSRWSARDIST